MYATSCKIIGKRLTNALLRKTFFHQFVAGENEQTLTRECEKLLAKGALKVMLCPPMEDLEGKCDNYEKKMADNMRRYMDFIEIGDKLNRTQSGQRALVQFKPTAIFPNNIMEEASKSAEQRNTNMCETVHEYANILRGIDGKLTDNHRIITAGLRHSAKFFEKAAEKNIPIIIDGELRNAYYILHSITLAASALYNRVDANAPTLVYGTFQCYLKDTPLYFKKSINVAKTMNFRVGAKFVRGAYMDLERRLAREQNRPDPIHTDHAATCIAYDRLISMAIEQIANSSGQLAIIVASMNRNSAISATNLMKQWKLPVDHPLIWFAQIYGMGDPLSYQLGNSGYTVFKSTPWGPLDEWIPYLSRRAAENYSAFQTARNELPIYRAEIAKRILPYRARRNT